MQDLIQLNKTTFVVPLGVVASGLTSPSKEMAGPL